MEAISPQSDPAVTLLDIDAVAARLQCSARHVRRLVDAGLMPAPVKLGALTRWPRPQIEAWIAGGCKAPTREARP